MKKYESYKDSGIEWIGEIPSHWEIFNLKFILRENIKDGPHETPVWFDDGIPFLSIDGIVNGEISFDKCRYIDEVQYENFSRKLVVEMDDIFIGKAASIGKIARVKTNRKFTVWSPIAVVKVRRDYNPTFVEYFFKSDIIQHQIEIFSTSNTQKNIAMGDIPKMKFISPSCYEQINIANYLDHKTTQIDDLIAKKERLIQLLEEERVAVINQAVTKGLDLTVPMKDSGIEWLGEIPEHWEVKRIKHLLNEPLKYGANESAEEENFDDPRYIRITDFGNDGKLKENTFKSLPYSKAENFLLSEGDILFARSGATVGKTFFFNNYKGIACFAGYLIKASCNRKLLLPEFLYEFTNTGSYDNWKQSIFQQATIQNIGADKYNQLKIAIPPISEQNKIVEFLENKTNEIVLIISKTQQEIELLKEYKTSLISEVVTGKVDVRNEEN